MPPINVSPEQLGWVHQAPHKGTRMKNLSDPAALTIVLAWLACVPTAGGADTPPLDDLDATLGPMRRVIERYSSDQSSLGRFDGTPMSPDRFRRLTDFYQGW